MRKISLILSICLISLCIFVSCGSKNITFTATIEAVSENSLLVTTQDENLSFDKAAVFYDEKLKMDFMPKTGQSIEITILPEVKESYPVQVTAVKITLKEDIQQSSYIKITPQEAKEMIDTQDVTILDVRTKEEYNEKHIENTLLIPDYELEEKANEMLPDKEAVILVYCRSGNRSAASSRLLVSMGYSNVYDFGGIIDWPYDAVSE
jgi:rhodanese-related sulfurtransferase